MENGFIFKVAGISDKNTIIKLLSSAFCDDPIVNYVSKSSVYPSFLFGMFVPHFLKEGTVLISECNRCALLASEYSTTKPFQPSLLKTIQFVRKFGLCSLFRLLKLSNLFDKYHPKENHLYVFAIGTDKAATGKGLGNAAINEVKRLAKEKNIPIYLENSNIEENRSFYQKLGFKSYKKVCVATENKTVAATFFDPLIFQKSKS